MLGAGLALPLETRQESTPNNLQSQRGVPLSSTVSNPPGSDGRAPTQAQQIADGLTINPSSAGQFQSMISFGGVPGLAYADWQTVSNSTILNQGTTPFSATVAEQMRLPAALSNGVMAIIMRRALIGAPYLGKQVSFAFGSVVEVPETDEKGVLLTTVAKDSYWLDEPYSTNHQNDEGFYWSPNARQVFAIEPGPIFITWKKAQPYTEATVPPDYSNPGGPPNYYTNGASIYLLYTQRYIVSGNPVKPSRKIYWTERDFYQMGKLVRVEAGQVQSLNIVYNKNFPKEVASEYSGPGSNRRNDELEEKRTLWYEKGFIHAYNLEGRVFVELLGNQKGGAQEALGFEIVDVFKQTTPADVSIELGERLLPPPPGDVNALYPEPVNTGGTTYAYQHQVAGSDRPEYYATRATINQNDYIIHWMEAGVAGIKWPNLMGRYQLIWPDDAAKYSHYVRPTASSEDEAKATAVTLATENVPVIEYQDAFDRPRANLTESYQFYTWLDDDYPAHRTLLRFVSGDDVGFERVFSWLETNLKTTNFSSTVATNLSSWDEADQTIYWASDMTSPRIVKETVLVGKRINPPTGEKGSPSNPGYLAGHINRDRGTSFNPQAYVDPFIAGFELANKKAIIPVNAIPDANTLEVWWFRGNSASAGRNAGNSAKGFKSIYWPSIIGIYTIQWPNDAPEIVLASKLGSGTLSPLESLGIVYHQNDATQEGYNPNEEHAIMSGGIVYATRDDLNITNAVNYSSHPFVLLSYQAEDGRPSMSAFHVLREKPESGYVFDYISPAGQILQPPMPLPLLAKPVEGSGDSAVNYNTEPRHSGGDMPGNWGDAYATNSVYSHYNQFTWRDRHQDYWIYRGLHAGLPTLEAGTYNTNNNMFVALSNATAVVDQSFRFSVHTSRQSEYLSLSGSGLPDWLKIRGLELQGTPTSSDVGSFNIELVIEDLYDKNRVTNRLALQVQSSGTVAAQAPLAICSTNNYTHTVVVFTNRPPFLARSPESSNSFTMRYYYKTEPSFAWPGIENPPSSGSIVPYLRPIDPNTGAYIGAGGHKDTESLEIVYRPVWPVRDPKDSSKGLATLHYGVTVAEAKSGLPGVRDMRTAQVLYQQSIAADLAASRASAVLHDPTREKYAELSNEESNLDFPEFPTSIQKDYYQGKYYFPKLAPHLARRVYYDPNRGSKGSLVLKGEYVRETLGENYLLLNVLRGSDLTAVKDLCPASDADNKPKWEALVDALSTTVEQFQESSSKPGTYEPGSSDKVGVQELAEVHDANIAVDSYALSSTGPGSGYVTLVEASGTAFTKSGDPVSMHIFKVGGGLNKGEIKVIAAENPLNEQITFQHTADLAGRFEEYEYEWKIAAPVDGRAPESDDQMTRYQALASGTEMPRHTLGGAGIQALGDNYIVMRYRPISSSHPFAGQWSDWTSPKLGEGWIKRVLAGINPFNQRITDLFSNRISTDASILTQAGRRWEGDVALNQENINNFGLIEIYETVLRRGRMLSIESGYNYGPANDALLLAAGYLNDLYMMIGNEAWADAANPTIGIGTKDLTYGDIATALFAFKGQVSSLLEEELALLRGRDDFLQPGVEIAPIYNRLVWNYTRGIDAGEVIYALNYNIQENPDQEPDGVINAEDAARQYPQGHGDAYGHYLTALKGYYSLLMNTCFDWVPRSETVNVLGQPVSVDYQDERKFAAAAAAVARAGRQVFDLTWRKDYQTLHSGGWGYLGATRINTQRDYSGDGGKTNSVRHWGADHWACRTGQGALLNWIVGNAILPAVDPNPEHEGIQKIDRTTVPELQELAKASDALQTALDNAEGGLSPLGIPEGGLAFDMNPSSVVGGENGAHFEQILQRAKLALNNAVTAFDDAKDVTALMRTEQDSLADFQAVVARQELAFKNALIELYGTPYPDDMGPGKTYSQDYSGPDLIHYMYVERPENTFSELWSYTAETTEFKIDVQDVPGNWATTLYSSLQADNDRENDEENDEEWLLPAIDGAGVDQRTDGEDYIIFNLGPDGFAGKPSGWTSRRRSPGKIQSAISEYIMAHTRLRQTLNDSVGAKNDLDKSIKYFQYYVENQESIWDINVSLAKAEEVVQWANFANDVWQQYQDTVKEDIQAATGVARDALPLSVLVGLSSGGDLTSVGRSILASAGHSVVSVMDKVAVLRFTLVKAMENATASARRWKELYDIDGKEWEQDLTEKVLALGNQLSQNQGLLWTINERLRELDDADRKKQALIAEGDRIQQERLVFRQRAAAVVQGYRSRDAAFRLFRNEKLERYKTLFELAARYALLAANAYDYETGLLNTSAGRKFINRIINARALGVVRHGEPQYAGSNTGDPGLSSTLAEMAADWSVLRGRLGFNNPDAYGTTVSLRTEALRILPTADGDANWQDALQSARRRNILEDEDVRRNCMQIDSGDGLPVPGLIFSFSTTIADGNNLFGRTLAAGDHTFSPSSFATKIFGAGVALVGYRGMSDPSANSSAVSSAGGVTPNDPNAWYLDPMALSATPYVYLIPVGVDSMRTPPLGDASGIRVWSVNDLAIPMPFNIGESDFSTKALWQSGDSLTEPLFAIRKHQAFRPVSTPAWFSSSLYTSLGSLHRSQYTNNRLIGRSIWNSHWKLVIPGKTLLNNPNEGLDRFTQTVKDVMLHFVTYSYSGN